MVQVRNRGHAGFSSLKTRDIGAFLFLLLYSSNPASFKVGSTSIWYTQRYVISVGHG